MSTQKQKIVFFLLGMLLVSAYLFMPATVQSIRSHDYIGQRFTNADIAAISYIEFTAKKTRSAEGVLNVLILDGNEILGQAQLSTEDLKKRYSKIALNLEEEIAVGDNFEIVFVYEGTGSVTVKKTRDRLPEGNAFTATREYSNHDLALTIDRKSGVLEGTVVFVGTPCQISKLQVPPCNGSYPNYEVIIYDARGKEPVAQTVTDEEGNYSLQLEPGRYMVYSQNGLGDDDIAIHRVNIKSGETTNLNLSIDTGIR